MKGGIKWIEAWIDVGGVYVLLVRETEKEKIEIVDPAKGYCVIEVLSNYEDSLHWLNEDEYDLMNGRYHLDH